jgi:hypothetical protein
MRPYKQSGRWQDVIDALDIKSIKYIDQPVYMVA